MQINNQHNNSFTSLNRKAVQGVLTKRLGNSDVAHYGIENMAQDLINSPVHTELRLVEGSKRRLEAVITDTNSKEHVMQEDKLSSYFSPLGFINNVVEFVKKLEK